MDAGHEATSLASIRTPAGDRGARPGYTVTDAPARLVPVDDDRDTGGFFEAARRHELVIRMCAGCDAILHMPRAYCRTCGGWEGRWRPVAGTGTVYSWTVVEHQVHLSFPTPYTVVLVELDDFPAVRLVGHLPGTPDLAAGQRMQVWFETLDAGIVIPQWKPFGDAGRSH